MKKLSIVLFLLVIVFMNSKGQKYPYQYSEKSTVAITDIFLLWDGTMRKVAADNILTTGAVKRNTIASESAGDGLVIGVLGDLEVRLNSNYLETYMDYIRLVDHSVDSQKLGLEAVYLRHLSDSLYPTFYILDDYFINDNGDTALFFDISENDIRTDYDFYLDQYKSIYLNGGTSRIYSDGIGAYWNTNDESILLQNSVAKYAEFDDDGIDLYYNDDLKLSTTTTGADVVGILEADSINPSNLNTNNIIYYNGTNLTDTDSKLTWSTNLSEYLSLIKTDSYAGNNGWNFYSLRTTTTPDGVASSYAIMNETGLNIPTYKAIRGLQYLYDIDSITTLNQYLSIQAGIQGLTATALPNDTCVLNFSSGYHTIAGVVGTLAGVILDSITGTGSVIACGVLGSDQALGDVTGYGVYSDGDFYADGAATITGALTMPAAGQIRFGDANTRIQASGGQLQFITNNNSTYINDLTGYPELYIGSAYLTDSANSFKIIHEQDPIEIKPKDTLYISEANGGNVVLCFNDTCFSATTLLGGVGTSSDREILFNNAGGVDGDPDYSWNDTLLTLKNVNNNIFIGSGNTATDVIAAGNNNVLMGTNNFRYLNGINNIGIGAYTGYTNTNGSDNIFFGYSAGNGTSYTGSKNIGIGYYSLGQGSSAMNMNTAIGYYSGYLSSGDSNIFIGPYSGVTGTYDSRLYIDNKQTANPLIYGDFAEDSLEINGDLNVTESLTANDDFIILKSIYANAYLPTDSTPVTSCASTANYYFVNGGFINTMGRGVTLDVDTLQVDRPDADSVYVRIEYTVQAQSTKNLASITFGFSDDGGAWGESEASVTISIGEKKKITHMFDKWVTDNEDIKFVVNSSIASTDVTISQANLNMEEKFTNRTYNK